jgi:hypothetical protein
VRDSDVKERRRKISEREQKRDGQKKIEKIEMFTKERETATETEKKDIEKKEIH